MDKNKRKFQTEFIKDNCAVMTVSEMSRHLRISASTINRILKTLNINKRKIYSRTVDVSSYNPNPVTLTTHMLVCRYFFEGSSVKVIANQLNRPENVIEEILNECIENGNYYKYNLYGRDDEKKADVKCAEAEKTVCVSKAV